MLAALSYAIPTQPRDETVVEPGFFTLVASIVRGLRARSEASRNREIGALIEQHGGRLTDDLERRISLSLR